MAGICSRHRSLTPVSGCKPCGVVPKDIFPDWDKKLAEAEAAGTTKCACGFTFYRTVKECPRCGLQDPNQK